MAEFHNVDGRTVRIVQLMPPSRWWWAVDYEHDLPEPILPRTVVAFALVEHDAGHGPEQDVVALVASDLGEIEIASDSPTFAGLTDTLVELSEDDENRDTWRRRWLARTKADELMGAMPEPAGNTFAQPFEDA